MNSGKKENIPAGLWPRPSELLDDPDFLDLDLSFTLNFNLLANFSSGSDCILGLKGLGSSEREASSPSLLLSWIHTEKGLHNIQSRKETMYDRLFASTDILNLEIRYNVQIQCIVCSPACTRWIKHRGNLLKSIKSGGICLYTHVLILFLIIQFSFSNELTESKRSSNNLKGFFNDIRLISMQTVANLISWLRPSCTLISNFRDFVALRSTVSYCTLSSIWARQRLCPYDQLILVIVVIMMMMITIIIMMITMIECLPHLIRWPTRRGAVKVIWWWRLVSIYLTWSRLIISDWSWFYSLIFNYFTIVPTTLFLAHFVPSTITAFLLTRHATLINCIQHHF